MKTKQPWSCSPVRELVDLTRQVNQLSNRIRGLYTQTHPALEAVLGPSLKYDAILEVIATWHTAAQLAKAGPARIAAKLKKTEPGATARGAKRSARR